MSASSSWPCPDPGRIPRARVDPIMSDADARSLIDALCPPPRRAEVLVVVLDDQWRGLAIVQVSGTTTPDAVVVVAEALPHIGPTDCAAVLLVSSRPADPVESDDVDLWIEASDLLGDAGIVLVEWYVVSEQGVECPRDLLGEPPRWARWGAAQ